MNLLPAPTRIACPHCRGELRLAWRDLVPVGAGEVYPCPHCPRAWRFPYAWAVFVQVVGILAVVVLAVALAELSLRLGIASNWRVLLGVPMALAALWLMRALNVRYLRRGRPLLPAWRFAGARGDDEAAAK
jgi:hypothetical protein